jgi:hypothetical protein
MNHAFTPKIYEIAERHFPGKGAKIVDASPLLQYLNIKTRSASRGSKARASFGNLYAIYVLVEDYKQRGYPDTGDYSEYEGARFSDLFKRQRELPFGQKLQNHHLNHRLNQEFAKYFPAVGHQPVMREVETRRYWINENLLKVRVDDTECNITHVVLDVIDAYGEAKKAAFDKFIKDCEEMASLGEEDPEKVKAFIRDRLQPNVDARVFEIVSYAILKAHYGSQSVFWGWSLDDLNEEALHLYKTGRTNANDGGIDFVMRPLGRFFQVTETLDVKKYFLDIDKIQRFPLTFVIKSDESVETLEASLRAGAQAAFSIQKIVDRYMGCIEEIINTPVLLERFSEVLANGKLSEVIDEIVLQSKVEFHYLEAA